MNRPIAIVVALLAALTIGAGVSVAGMAPAWSATGSISASGANQGSINVSITFDDSTANFGSNLDPSGADSNSTDVVVDYQGAIGNQGSYYVWKGSNGNGVRVRVQSNKVWDGFVGATENTGTSSTMTIVSGVLRWTEGAAPSNYAECSSSAAFQTSLQTWKSNQPKGTQHFYHFYCLRVDWDDAPGTFSSTISYVVTQS